jgi:tRNA-2-methylthio-N6-dimethylallyladenosine synthase
VPDSVKSERLYILQELLVKQQTDFNKNTIGDILPVLLEDRGRHENQYQGKSPYLQTVLIESRSSDLLGKIVNVKVQRSTQNALYGEVIQAI